MNVRTYHPTQIGTFPSGYAASTPSQVVIGRDVGLSEPNIEGVGFGQGGRPDFVERIKFYITKNTSADKTQNGTLTTYSTVTIDVEDLIAVVNSNANAAAALNFSFREVDVCDNGTAKKMLILAGPTYLP